MPRLRMQRRGGHAPPPPRLVLSLLVSAVLAALVDVSRSLYTVEVDRTGRGGMNVLYDSVHHPETTDFAHNFGCGPAARACPHTGC